MEDFQNFQIILILTQCDAEGTVFVNLLRLYLGFFEDAIQAHREEICFSEAIDDTIGIAIGNRKVGECLCELRNFADALRHGKIHLQVKVAFVFNRGVLVTDDLYVNTSDGGNTFMFSIFV